MTETWKKLMSASLSFAMLTSIVGCSENNTDKGQNAVTNNTTTNVPEQETKKTVEDLIQLAEDNFKQGEFGSAKKQLLEAYERIKEAKEPYKVYADLYLSYVLTGKKEAAKALHREVLDESDEVQNQYMNYMKQIIKDCNLVDMDLPSISKKEEEKKDNKAPEFTMFSKDIYADVGEHFDYNVFFKAKDESDFTISYDDSKINFNVEGSYPLYVSAQDKYGNKVSDQANIHIVDNSFKYSVGVYKAEYTMNLRKEPTTKSAIVVEVPKGSKMIFHQIMKQSDGSYWGLLTSGYVCIEDANGKYLSYYSGLQIYLAQYKDLDAFSIACGFGPGGIPTFGMTHVPKGLNYTILCNEGSVLY
ncbi:MAG: hypothetical protein Q4C49_06375 [Bacillota bacterium]|nr:hypothetical protein [Bacillota bacterium]